MLCRRRSSRRVTAWTWPAAGGSAGLSRPGGHSAPAAHPAGWRGQTAAVLHAVLLVGHGDLDGLAAQPHLPGHGAQGVLLLGLRPEPHEAVALAEAGLVQNDLSTSHCPVSGGEVSVQSEVVHLGGEVPHPDGGVDLEEKINVNTDNV